MSENTQIVKSNASPMPNSSDFHQDDDAPPGFCSATCVDKDCLMNAIAKPAHELKTSDIFHTCNLPRRFEHPHWFNGYGCQLNKQHPFYRTSSNDYGWYAPGIHSVPTEYHPRNQNFSSALASAGMYRNYSLNTSPEMSPLD